MCFFGNDKYGSDFFFDLIFEMIEIPAIAFYIHFLHGARYIEVWTLALTLFFY